jgi:hypothetical protein
VLTLTLLVEAALAVLAGAELAADELLAAGALARELELLLLPHAATITAALSSAAVPPARNFRV